MPTLASKYEMAELSHEESPSEIFLDTKLNTELHIIACSDRTLIRLPFGNKFDVVDGVIIIHET